MRLDLTGQKFNKLTALYPTGEVSEKSRNAIWFCKCDCGNYTTAHTGELRGGRKKSCGCAIAEHARNMNLKHDGAHERLYNIWVGMRKRCYNASSPNYHSYGGRGITVCEEWNDYEKFRKWALDNGYDTAAKRGECTIDRIDVNGGYSPQNCRWADINTQQNNKTNSAYITYNGITKTATQWSRDSGYERHTVSRRIKKGWSVEEAITTPIRPKRRAV